MEVKDFTEVRKPLGFCGLKKDWIMQMSMTYGDISANISIDHQLWGADNVTVRLMDYDVIHAAQKEPQTLKVTDHISVHTTTGDNVCCRCIIK